MNLPFKNIAVLSLLLLSCMSSFSQNGLTLEECINLAVQNNIQLKRSDLLADGAHKAYNQGFFEFAPSVNGNFYHEQVDGTAFNQYQLKFVDYKNQSGSLSVAAEMDVFKGLSNWYNLSRLKYDWLAQRESSEILKHNLTLNVIAFYLQVLYDLENLTLAQEQLETLQLQVAKAKAQHELGSRSTSELLELSSQALNQKALLTVAENRVKLSRLGLAQLIEYENPHELQIAVSPFQFEDVNAEEASNLGDDILSGRPEMRKAQFEVLSAGRSLKSAYGLLSPRIAVGYQVGSGYDQSAWYPKVSGADTVIIRYPDYTYRNQLEDYLSNRMYFRVQIPIFHKLSNYNRVAQSRIRLHDAQYALVEARKNLNKTIQQAVNDAHSARASFDSHSESAKSYQEIYDMARQKYDLGMLSAIELGIARGNYLKALGDLLQAKYTYSMKRKILAFYRGNPIGL